MAEAAPMCDFPAISDDGRKGPKPGDAWTESVWDAAGSGFEKGSPSGSVTIEAQRGGGPPRLRASFAFSDGDSVILEGEVPGMGTWLGSGRVAYVSGTGKFVGRTGEIDVEFVNPKKWG